MKYRGSAILLVALLAAGVAHAGTGVRVYAKVDSDTTIYPGQAFTYSVVVEGSKPTRIDITPLERFSPRRVGPSTEIQTISGRTSMRHSENYAIVAGPPGTMVLPGVTVVVDGQTYTTNPVEVSISTEVVSSLLRRKASVRATFLGIPVLVSRSTRSSSSLPARGWHVCSK